ncbi:hypothetical protein HYU18_02925 [Candidatus Woesearchaeota archaeon]|nr:hypothetical protein [Candidatus Woesearchaeota archaeon]
MAKGNIVAVIMILLIVVLVSGCKGGSRGVEIPDAFTGVEGMNAWVAPESVASPITAGSSVDFALMISNKGATTVPEGAIITLRDTRGAFTVEGVDLAGDSSFSFKTPIITVKKQLEGKETTSAAGYLNGFRVTARARSFSDNDEAIDTGFLASACYQYVTKLAANVCVDTSTYSFQKQRKACDSKVPVALKSQGAPVAVRKIETVMERYDVNGKKVIRPKFKIYVANVGNGIVIDKDSLDLFCTAKTISGDKDRINVVFIDRAELNGQALECSKDADGGIHLSGKAEKDYILCSYRPKGFETEFTEEANLGAFVTSLKLELRYGYNAISAPVPIRVEKGLGCKPKDKRACTTRDNLKGWQTCSDEGSWGSECKA